MGVCVQQLECRRCQRKRELERLGDLGPHRSIQLRLCHPVSEDQRVKVFLLKIFGGVVGGVEDIDVAADVVEDLAPDARLFGREQGKTGGDFGKAGGSFVERRGGIGRSQRRFEFGEPGKIFADDRIKFRFACGGLLIAAAEEKRPMRAPRRLNPRESATVSLSLW